MLVSWSLDVSLLPLTNPGRKYRFRQDPRRGLTDRRIASAVDIELVSMNSTEGMVDRRLLPDDVETIVDEVDGWLRPHEGRLLYPLAARADPAGSVVDIGSWHGTST